MNCLIVEDDVILAGALSRALADWGACVKSAATLAAGLSALSERPDLMVFDISLPDGSGVALAKAAAQLKPVPLMIAISGKASGREGYELARYGVLEYVAKPLSLNDFTLVVESSLAKAPDVVPLLVAAVGKETFHELLARVRKALVEQALARSGGNRTVAAKLLGVTRQAVQYQIRDLDLDVAETDPS